MVKKKELLISAIKIAGIALILCVAFCFIFSFRKMDENNMWPSIKNGDLMLVFKAAGTLSQGDCVLYEADGKIWAGRIMAKENDVVDITESGEFLVNGVNLDDGILISTESLDGTIQYPYCVPEGELFILSDYRTEGNDSRQFGSVEKEKIEGLIIAVLRRKEI